MSGTDVVRDIPQLQLPASRRKISIFKDKRSSRTKNFALRLNGSYREPYPALCDLQVGRRSWLTGWRL